MSYLSLVIYINEEDYGTLISEGEITKNGETYEYDDSTLYIIKDISAPEYAETAGYALNATNASAASRATSDDLGNNIAQTYGKKPLIIEVDETDLPKNLPNGTYNSITLALADKREVIIKVNRDGADDEIIYCRFSEDWSDQESNYYFYNSSNGLGIVLGGNNIIDRTGWYSPNYHSHGNITQNGLLSTTATIANGDKLVITDASASNVIKASSISFDGSTTSKALTQKGTWENVVNSVNGQSGAVTLGTAASLNAGSANGVATLDSSGKVPANQLPSYVDDIVEGYYKEADGKFYSNLSGTTYSNEITGESGKIYVDLTTSKSYRWSGSSYIIINANSEPEIIIHEISSTTYPNASWSDAETSEGCIILDLSLYNAVFQEVADGKEVLIKVPLFGAISVYLRVIYTVEGYIGFENTVFLEETSFSVEFTEGNITYRVLGFRYLNTATSTTDNLSEGSTNLWNKLADWNQTTTTAGDYIKNKPTIPTHWANVTVGTSANYITEPEFKSVKINGSTTNAASTDNCYLLYDTTNKCLKFIFN